MAAETYEEFFNVTEEQTDRLAEFMFNTMIENFREGFTTTALLEKCLAICNTEAERLWTIYSVGNFNGLVSLIEGYPRALALQRLYFELKAKNDLCLTQKK